MNCPYCVSVIDDAALACPHCTRDLYLFKPLLARIQTLESALLDATGRIAALESPVAVEADSVQVTPAAAAESESEPVVWPAWALLLPALLLLLAAHFVIVINLDLPTVWLRVASLLIPLPFGLLLVRSSPQGWARTLLMTAGVAVIAVLGMSAAVAVTDGTPVLPANAREWREFAYYAVSIFLSFATGMIVSNSRGRRTLVHLSRHALVLRMAGAVWGAARDPAKVQKQLEAMHGLIGTLAATATAAASITSGLTGVLGH